ncbi:SDR family oxidoreductase [Mucilaginibacter polytrichastri]|uniref:NAD(P)-binding domain-containing protein n=1 Tax=Mucilaginibacter polytrichastri TaxID=1302689 RepID=A0A1Q5ZYH9_9SPHI|nr:SDR family oxidoreductase [Mucilaginibacter polytrichastri]OKS86799.1 hypothetical protein RG47T_2256 [Mucilaginibacter polytrichastri]SFT22734.1 Nucleoside-diphosphate-sugar epimerase [Mucilaginibacter polytrichastri]
MTVSILGCGWFGLALANALLKNGEIVKGSTTSEAKLGLLANAGVIPYLVQFEENGEQFDPAFFDCDLLVVCIPPKIKSGETTAFLNKINSIIAVINEYNILRVIYIGSTGVYGDLGIKVDESKDPQPDTASGMVLLQAEQAFQNQISFKATIVRFGGLVGPGRHPGRFFGGKKDIANGLAPVNLIHQKDAVGVVVVIVNDNNLRGVFNACSPDHPSRSDFYTYAAEQGGYEKPEFVEELKGWKIVKSARLQELNYDFEVKDWLAFRF